MLSEQNKRDRLKFVCNLLNIVGRGCLLSWYVYVGLLALHILLALTSETKTKQGDRGINNIGAMNRAQQAVYTETGKWAASMDRLGGGIKSQTKQYDYLIKVVDGGVKNIALPREKNLRAYIGIVWADKNQINPSNKSGINKTTRTEAIICGGCGLKRREIELILNLEIRPGECPGGLNTVNTYKSF
jgi:hypothetical protein